jgi:hypothetical protein
MSECYRVLKSNGKLLSISHGKLKNRKFYYSNKLAPFAIKIQSIRIRSINSEIKVDKSGKEVLK